MVDGLVLNTRCTAEFGRLSFSSLLPLLLQVVAAVGAAVAAAVAADDDVDVDVPDDQIVQNFRCFSDCSFPDPHVDLQQRLHLFINQHLGRGRECAHVVEGRVKKMGCGVHVDVVADANVWALPETLVEREWTQTEQRETHREKRE